MQLFNRAHLALLAAAGIAQAQSYANNSRSHVPDNPLVAAAFPDVDIELLSPAFLNPETIPAGFAENTAGPTDQATLGMSLFASSCRETDLVDMPLLTPC